MHETKHNPYCDCGICAYCNGQEDVYGNSSGAALTRQPDPRDARITELEAALRELRLTARALIPRLPVGTWIGELNLMTQKVDKLLTPTTEGDER